MLNRRRLFLAITLVGCLLLASSASADPLGSEALTVEITAKPSDPSNDTSPSFAFTASNGNATFVCKLDTVSGPCTSPQEYPSVAPGLHTFVVEAARGDEVAQATYSWTIDTVGPTTTIGAKPNHPTNDKTPTFTFTSEPESTFACKLDTGAFAGCSSPTGYPPLPDGEHKFFVRATDALGNIGPEASYTWTIDTIAPAAPLNTDKPSILSKNSSASFSFTPNAGGTFCRLDAAAPALCTSPISYTSLPDGPHTFGVKAIDAAGNASGETSYTWTIETRAPTAALFSAPSGLSNNSAATFAFSADEPSSFECALDNRGFEPCSSPATYHGLGDGQHAFKVRARDAVGNFSPAVPHSWAIDTTAPETTLASTPKSGTTTTSATFAFSASESGSFECRLDGAPFALCGSPMSYGGLAKGDHRFEVRAIDAAGNADATPALHPWKIQAPLRTIASSALLAPRSGARVTKPPLLVWRRVARARYYNVQLFRGKQKILSAWPTRARLRLQARWKFAGRVRRLTPGAYRWYVWPGYGVPSARNYGQLLGQSTFVVARSVRR
jgi:large repetitive protein